MLGRWLQCRAETPREAEFGFLYSGPALRPVNQAQVVNTHSFTWSVSRPFVKDREGRVTSWDQRGSPILLQGAPTARGTPRARSPRSRWPSAGHYPNPPRGPVKLQGPLSVGAGRNPGGQPASWRSCIPPSWSEGCFPRVWQEPA